jgi:CHAT domain-containing protein/tetratricopeptide (TPR) repeat protein
LYAPYSALIRSATAAQASPGFRAALGLSSAEARDLGSPEALARRGVADLLAGRATSAIARLDRAVLLSNRQPLWWSDLAAAHLAFPENPQHLLAALSAADRAVELAPALKEAWFNRAFALQGLWLIGDARNAWNRYLGLEDPASQWAEEAKAHRAELDHPPEAKRWASERDLLQASTLQEDTRKVERIVFRFPQCARLFAEEELLAEWAEAVRSGRPAEAAKALVIAGGIGRALQRLSGDAMLSATVDRLKRSTGAPRDWLMAGHLSYREGVVKLQEGDVEGAGPPLETAYEYLRKAESPFSYWALFQLAYRDYLLKDTERALDRFSEVRRISAANSYSSLAGRASWLLGTVLLFNARPSESLAAFRESLRLLESTRERNYLAGIHLLLARNLDFLGDSRNAWIHRYAALRGAVETGDPDRIRIVFADTAWELPEPRLALYFQEEAVRAAREIGNPGSLATALRQRAAVRRRAGDVAGALRDLQDAQTEAERLSSSASRVTTLYELRITEAQIRRDVDPKGALAAADSALAMGKDRYFVPALLVERARAYLALRDPVAAEQDLDAAVAELEAQRNRIDEALQRASYLDQAREAFEQLVDIRLANRRGSEAALDAAERARSRVLFDWVAALPEGTPRRAAALRSFASVRPVTELRPIAELRRELPPNTVVVEYMVREDRTLAWILDPGSVDLKILPIGARGIERRLATWRKALDEGGSERERQAAAGLYRILIAPLSRHLPPRSKVVFIPDKALYSLPFSALLDTTTDRRLIQDFVVSVNPSVNVLALCSERARLLRGAKGILVIADPRFDQTLLPNLLPLPAASGEAAAIASFHEASLVLSGEEATKSRFLEEVGRHGIVHFVGHSLRNAENPLLSALVLAPKSSGGESLLYAHEILGKRFKGTRLVVLSACSTGLGAPSQTEGALSLAAPFLAAGVPAVVASLWDVSDAASAELMASFHFHLRQGEDVAAALRSAQLQMIGKTGSPFAEPRAWAPFELIGGW